jgi:hypothetical protein
MLRYWIYKSAMDREFATSSTVAPSMSAVWDHCGVSADRVVSQEQGVPAKQYEVEIGRFRGL